MWCFFFVPLHGRLRRPNPDQQPGDRVRLDDRYFRGWRRYRPGHQQPLGGRRWLAVGRPGRQRPRFGVTGCDHCAGGDVHVVLVDGGQPGQRGRDKDDGRLLEPDASRRPVVRHDRANRYIYGLGGGTGQRHRHVDKQHRGVRRRIGTRVPLRRDFRQRLARPGEQHAKRHPLSGLTHRGGRRDRSRLGDPDLRRREQFIGPERCRLDPARLDTARLLTARVDPARVDTAWPDLRRRYGDWRAVRPPSRGTNPVQQPLVRHRDHLPARLRPDVDTVHRVGRRPRRFDLRQCPARVGKSGRCPDGHFDWHQAAGISPSAAFQLGQPRKPGPWLQPAGLDPAWVHPAGLDPAGLDWFGGDDARVLRRVGGMVHGPSGPQPASRLFQLRDHP